MKRLVALFVAAVVVAATAYLFVWPDEDEVPASADAVVVLSGGRSDRFPEGVRLVRAGVAPTLVVSDGRAEGWDEANRLCERGDAVCFHPEPYSTQGEARWIAREARRRGWDSIVVVTSSYHVRRARVIVERCFHGRLAVVGTDAPAANRILGIAWEWPKSLYYLAWNRGC